MCSSIREACSRQFKSSYQCGYVWHNGECPYTVRLSNCEDMMRLETSWDGKITPSGELQDGYAGIPVDSPLWKLLHLKYLVSKEQFWSRWAPDEWAFGQ